jgi:3-hydroxyisobutyrate dehydrogenase-like beta-hydroxyacid dehydrogenase
MGSAIAASLLRAGYKVVGYDIAAARRREHARAGGRVARSAADVGRAAEIVICSLPSAAALAAVAEALATRQRGKRIVIETSTLPIPAKLAARRRLAAAGVTLLDCPLSGTGAQARTRDLVVFASGPRTAYRRIVPVLDAFARAHHHVGLFGAGSKTKFVANLLVGIHNVAAAEALVLAMKAGLDPAKTLGIVADGAGGSRMLQVRGPSMVRNDYSNAMNRLSLWAKDLAVITEFARGLGCPTPLFSATVPLYQAATGMGREDEDTAAVCAVLESMAGYRRPPKSSRRRGSK